MTHQRLGGFAAGNLDTTCADAVSNRLTALAPRKDTSAEPIRIDAGLRRHHRRRRPDRSALAGDLGRGGKRALLLEQTDGVVLDAWLHTVNTCCNGRSTPSPQDDDQVQVHARSTTSDEEQTFTARYLVACDGRAATSAVIWASPPSSRRSGAPTRR